MSIAKEEKQEKLRKLQEKYISQLPEKLATLNEVWRKAINNDDVSALEELRQLAHNMAGSAGTFGFGAVSVEARNLEQLLRKTEVNQVLNKDEQETISDGLKRISSLVELGPDKRNANIDISVNKSTIIEDAGRLIYVLEDDELLAKEICTQLQYYDYEVKTFTTVVEAMQAIKSRIPTAMIIDVQLPEGELAGPEFAVLFNEFSINPVPSIFISARDDLQARLAAVRANGSAYLTKPIEFNELLERIDMLTTMQAPSPFRVLIVDDMAVLAEHYAAVLANDGMQVKTVTNIDNLLEVLSDYKPELILMDIYMPQCTGLEAAKIIRHKDEFLSVPIVFLSTEVDPLKHMSAMELGGDDFLQKPILDQRLVTAVRSRAQRFRNLRSHMHSDGLTGLLNHVTIKNQLANEISRAHRQKTDLSFAMIDIDDFKEVNDTYGHPVGDRVIKSVARMLIKRLRKSDMVGRYGGEEFAIIFPDTDIKTAKKILDDVRESFSKIIQQSEAGQFSCTFSVGVTTLVTESDINSVINIADEALYDAKHHGRNNVQVK